VANVFYGHQATIDTVQTSPLIESNIKIRGGVWSGATAGDTLTIVDLAGKTFTFTAPVDTELQIGPLGWIRGLTIPVIDSGVLNLYLDK
jgi:hypothetical protein